MKKQESPHYSLFTIRFSLKKAPPRLAGLAKTYLLTEPSPRGEEIRYFRVFIADQITTW